jgi:hypothetical protein
VKARRLLRSPAETLLLIRMSFWATIVPVLKRVLPLPRLVRLAATGRAAGGRNRAREERVIASVVRIYRSGLIRQSDNCLERSLVTYRYLGALHAEPQLVVGMSRREKGTGHVWVTVDGRPVHDTAETLDDMEPIVTFAADGTRVDA